MASFFILCLQLNIKLSNVEECIFIDAFLNKILKLTFIVSGMNEDASYISVKNPQNRVLSVFN